MVQIRIEKLIHGGNGLGNADGKKIFVPFSVPGDVLEVEITEDHGSFAEARIQEIKEPSPDRVEPPCAVFGQCGGCQWQHIAYEAQLKWKREILIEELSRIGKIEAPNVLEVIPSPQQWHYRNRIQLHVDGKGHAGYYRTKTHEVVEFDACLIADERLNQELKERREEIRRRDRGIALRVVDEEGFSQVNVEQNRKLKELLCQWLAELPHEAVLELHAGTGNFSFALAEVAREVIATEIDGRAIRTATQSLQERGVENLRFHIASEKQAVQKFGAGAETIVLDPPRKGCAEAIAGITALKPPAILAISCDPATLARDLRTLMASGYRLVRTQPIDMFPQTFHIESLSMLVLSA